MCITSLASPATSLYFFLLQPYRLTWSALCASLFLISGHLHMLTFLSTIIFPSPVALTHFHTWLLKPQTSEPSLLITLTIAMKISINLFSRKHILLCTYLKFPRILGRCNLSFSMPGDHKAITFLCSHRPVLPF